MSDPNSTLVLNITTTSGVGNNNQPQTVIEMDVITGTTNVLAYITLQNLRFNVTTIGDGATLNAYLSSTAPPTTPSPTAVGTVRNTIEWAPAPPAVTTVGLGVQSSGGPLATKPSSILIAIPTGLLRRRSGLRSPLRQSRVIFQLARPR